MSLEVSLFAHFVFQSETYAEVMTLQWNRESQLTIYILYLTHDLCQRYKNKCILVQQS